MTLSSVNEGFVLLRNLWEYNSILKYRYKKRKAYKVATMKHLPAPLAREYKSNLAVRFVKATFSHFINGLQGIGSLISGETNNNDSWIRQESRTTPTQIQQVDFTFWERELGVTILYAYNSVANIYEYITLKKTLPDTEFMEWCHHVSSSQVEYAIQSMYAKLTKNMANYVPPKTSGEVARKVLGVSELKSYEGLNQTADNILDAYSIYQQTGKVYDYDYDNEVPVQITRSSNLS